MRKKIFLSILLSVAILLVLTPLGCDNTNPTNTPDATPTQGVTLDPTPTTEPTEVPTPTPMVEDTIVGRYFGPLHTVASPKEVEHNEVRALYIGAAADGALLDRYIEIANNSVINAFVVDIKESNGLRYNSKNELANEIGAVSNMYNVEQLIQKANENNITIIGRIVIFKDYYLAEARPDLCILDRNGNPVLYKSLEGGKPFVSPYNREVWQYNIDLAIEAIELGFDEIQFDYVRFPTGSRAEIESEYFGEEGTVPEKYEAINRFLTEARIEIQDRLGKPLGADIFGIVMTSKLDGYLIGQDWETLGKIGLDNLAPMIYPSHYAKGTVMNGITYSNPDADTYAFLDAVFKQEKFSKQEGFSELRPYIQAYSYTNEQLFGQIRALKENGINQYQYWNAGANYSLDVVLKD